MSTTAKKRAIIITGMGRSGSMWLANYLDIPHEPTSLGKIFMAKSNGEMDDANALEICERYFNEVKDGHVEVSSYWRLFIPYLKKAGFQVIGLVRHPQDVVASIYNLSGGKSKWMYPIDNFKRDILFSKTSYLERLCMLWADACNRTRSCEHVYRFEDLLSDAKVMFKLCKMLGITFDLPKWKRERSRKKNRTCFSKRLFRWSDDDSVILKKICGGWMGMLSYLWKQCSGRKIALNIGCGIDYREEDNSYQWVNIDAAENADKDDDVDIFNMDVFYFEKCHYIEARDVLEHVDFNFFEQYKWMDALKSWVRCLAMDGVIRVQTPDPYGLFKLLESGEIDEMDYNRRVYSERTSKYEVHYQMFSRARLKRALLDCGLSIEKEELVNGNAIVTARRIK